MKKLRSLAWRIGLPFVAFVLLGSLAVALLLQAELERGRRAEFARLARTNAEFVARSRLPRSPRMARNLEQVLGIEVYFRGASGTVAALGESAPEWVQRAAPSAAPGLELASAPIDEDTELVLVRPAASVWRELMRGPSLGVLGLFWLLAALLAIVVGRAVVVPLQRLAHRVPTIDLDAPLSLGEARREDEIGDVARAFERAVAALREERATRARAEKLALLGQMTSALAHEVKNPVASIRMQAQLLLRDGDSAAARQIAGEAERIDDLVSQWQYLSRPEPGATRVLELRALVEEQLRALEVQSAHARVACEVEVARGVRVRGDALRLGQALRNLLVNAIQAMPMGGRLRVVASVDGARDGERVLVHIDDEGRGFSPDALARHAEFFYTEREGGMGIGLSVAQEIAEAHGGALRVANRLGGNGARVTLELPTCRPSTS